MKEATETLVETSDGGVSKLSSVSSLSQSVDGKEGVDIADVSASTISMGDSRVCGSFCDSAAAS
jgi:hypothetical protein|tara:strand:- start:5123 stop:5314 length:192 start_codon:yes stop_codon:yes gene_type:complete